MCRVIHVLVCGKLDSNTYTVQLQGKTQIPTWRRNVFRQLLFVVWTLCTDHDEISEEGKKYFILSGKRGMASEPEEGTGHPLSWTSLQRMEVAAGSGKGGTKQKEHGALNWKK